MVNPNLLVASGQVVDAYVLDVEENDMAGDALAKEGSVEPSLLAEGRGHVLCTEKDQVTVGFVILASYFGWAPCIGWGWCCIPGTVCWCDVIVGLIDHGIDGRLPQCDCCWVM